MNAAEDLVQLTFLRAIEQAGSFDEKRPVLSWLSTILADRARDQQRQRARQQHEHDLIELVAPERGPDHLSAEREVRDRESAAIGELEVTDYSVEAILPPSWCLLAASPRPESRK